MVREAIRLLLNSPSLSNLEIARRLKVNEGTIRHWKKQPFWEVERQKLIAERVETMGLNEPNQLDEFKRELQQQQQDLKRLRDGIYAIGMRSLNLTNRAYKQLLQIDDSIKGCTIATKAGTHIQGRVGIKAALAIIKIDEYLYQIDILIDYLRKLEQEKDC